MPQQVINKKGFFYFVLLLSAALYIHFAYFTIRQDFTLVLGQYTLLFISFLFITSPSKLSFKQLSYLALGFRLVLVASVPNLSNDFYRFIWDGRMILEGLNPYLTTPELFLQGNSAALIHEGERLYKGMGMLNGHHYTCYPPINQIGFIIPALFYSENIFGSTIIMRLCIIAGDIGVWWIGPKIFTHFGWNPKRIFLYLLNPFIILELTGNLHFEGLMIFFLLWSIYLLLKNKWQWSAVVMALSIGVKLIPLIFLPLLLRRLGFKKMVIYCLICIGFCSLLFLPFLSAEFVRNFMSSINLYFQSFEFNASIYYIIREVGFQVKGYNIIQDVSKVLPWISIGIILVLSFWRNTKEDKTLMTTFMWVFASYLILSTTVHPWYIAVVLSLSVFTKSKFPVVWSFAIILSYSAYQTEIYQENLVLVAVEYTIVFGYLLFEIFKVIKPSKKLEV